jgi:hypothetical protein
MESYFLFLIYFVLIGCLATLLKIRTCLKEISIKLEEIRMEI